MFNKTKKIGLGKKLITIFLSFVIMAAMLTMPNITALATDGNYWTDSMNYDISWYLDGGSTYSISTAAGLAGLAVLTNGLNSVTAVDFSGKTITLSQSIDLSAHLWTPIGSSINRFKGTFDGGGNTITGLTTAGTIDYQGLFGYSTGTIKNLGLVGGNSTGNYVGGIVGSNSGTITSCYNTGTVTGTSNVGGIVGSNSGTITSCYNTGTVTGTSNVGGIAGYANSGTILTNYYCGCSIGIGGVPSDPIGGTTKFVALTSSSITVGGTTTILEPAISSNFMGTGLVVTYSNFQSSVANITDPIVTGTAAGSGTIAGTMTIKQNGLTSSGFTGMTYSIIVPISLPIVVAAPTYSSTDALAHTTVSVANGATLANAKLALDSTVGVVGALSETDTATIAWTIASYSATVAGSYTATGVLTLPAGWTGTATDVTATVTVSAPLSSDASIEAGTLGGAALTSLPRDGAANISSSAYIGVTVSVGDKALEFTKGNTNSVIKYDLITTGNSPQPANDAAYTGTYASGSTTINITSSNDRIWLLVTAQDGTKGYYWITVYIANADQAAPTGLTGVAPTTSGGTDGTISGTTTTMQYKLASADDAAYTTCTVDQAGLSAGSYVVRYAAKTGFNAGTTAPVTVPAYVAPTTTTYTVTFDSQGGTPTPVPITGIASGATVTLPAAPTKAGYTLNGWFTAITGGTAFTASTAVTADVTVYAQWTVTYIPAPVPAPVPAPLPSPSWIRGLILQIGKPVLWNNSVPTKLDSAPVIKNSRTLLPIRAIIEALGGTVAWDPIAHKVTVRLGTRTVVLWIGKSLATVNGVSTPIDATDASVVPEIINSRTMLPLRFVAENLGCTVLWAAATQTITITYTP